MIDIILLLCCIVMTALWGMNYHELRDQNKELRKQNRIFVDMNYSLMEQNLEPKKDQVIKVNEMTER